MQPTDSLTVSRRAMDVEDYIDILRRHKSWILGPAFLGLVTAVVVAFLWPDTYVSTGVIRVVPSSVPEKYVPTNVNQELSQRINAMAQGITSRATLTNIIQSFGLYPREQKRLPTDDIVEDMRKNAIHISPVFSQGGGPRGDMSAFQISFAYENRFLAQKVASDLVRRFIDENVSQRTRESSQTTEFLQDQLESAKRDLDAVEKKLTDFRLSNFGHLPDQLDSNLERLNALGRRVDTLNSTISRINQEKLLLEGQLKILKDQQTAITSPGPESIVTIPKSDALLQAEREVSSMEMALASARERYKDAHPDVKRIESQLALVRRRRDTLAEEDKARMKEARPEEMPAAAVKELRDLHASISRLETLLRSKDNDLLETAKELEQAQAASRSLQGKLETVPVGEQKYQELIRERSLAYARYEDMNRKRAQSAVATDLENRHQSETLEILDQPSLPQTPSQPNRYMIVLGGIAIGLVIGIFMAGIREMKDTSLKNLKDVRAYTQLTVLGSIPLLENDLVMRRRRRLTWLAWSTAFLLGVLVMSGSVYYYYVSNG